MRVLFYSADILRSSIPGAAFQVTLRELLQGAKEGSQKYIEVLQPMASSLNIKLLSLIKENQISQVKEFSAFLYMRRYKSLGSGNHSFAMHLSYLGPVSCVFLFWVSPGLTIGNGCSLTAARWQEFFVSFLSSHSTQWLTLEGWNHLWLWHSLFINMTGNILFLKVVLGKLNSYM